YGPLVVACVAVKSSEINELRRIGVKDSKTLSKTALKIIAREIKANPKLVWRHVAFLPSEYNSILSKFKAEGKNLNHMLAMGHERVIRGAVTELQRTDAALKGSAMRITIDEFDSKKMA